MNLLLDTHAFLWWDAAPEKLSARALSLCEDSANTVALSVASVWEMQIKLQLGKLRIKSSIRAVVDRQREKNAMHVLPVDLPHVYALQDLPAHHRDPFDRLLEAQAKVEGFSVVSTDSMLRQYPVQIIW